MSLEWAEFVATWSNWILISSLIAGVLATCGVVISGTAKERALKTNLADSSRKFDEYKIAAEQKVAVLTNETAELTADAESSRALIAAANKKAAELNARAATLENEAAQARLNLEKLRAQMAWRRIDERQLGIISANLRGLPFPVALYAVANDPEAMQLGVDIQNAFKTAGFDIGLGASSILGNEPVTGLIISGPKDKILRLAKPFTDAGIQVIGEIRDGDVEILVGSKPQQN